MPFAASDTLQHVGSPVHFHYVAPSFWAWRGGEARLKWLSQFIDHMLCILPFEEEVCRLNGLAATFVGHPVLEDCLELNLVCLMTLQYCEMHFTGEFCLLCCILVNNILLDLQS